jgi:hypothetical protein
MRIYKKSVSFVRHNPKFGVKLAIIWEMSIFNEDCGPSLSLTLNLLTVTIYCLCLGAFVAILSGLSGLGTGTT